MRLAVLATVLLFGTPAFAITFVPAKKPDPFAPGAECNAPELASWGSYIYSWPSKYDLVFSPWDYPNFTWRCPKSGYIAFPHDFDKLTDDERKRLAGFLKTHPWRKEFEGEPNGPGERDQMEMLYLLRTQTRADRAFFLRLRAWEYRADPRADLYRARALALHKEILSEEKPAGFDLLETLYILGFYEWKLGDRTVAEDYFRRARAVEYTDNEGKSRTGSDYINGLIDDVKAGKADDAVRFKADGE